MRETKVLPPWVSILAVGTAFFTWILIMLGGVVHGTGSSLACPDWPTCFGTFFPEMKGGVFFEHLHRLVASGVGLLTLVLGVTLWKKGDGIFKALGVLAVALVIFQGILGGITVIYRLPPAVSIGHLGTSMAFLALMVWIAARSFLPVGSHLALSLDRSPVGPWITFSLILVYLQILLGALVRHLGAGLACTEIPLCHGSLWPAHAPFLLKLHMIHRIFALVVAVFIFANAGKILRHTSKGAPIRLLAMASVFLLILQIGLGLYSVSTALALIPVTLHLGIGALLWASMVLQYFCYSRNVAMKPPEKDFPLVEKVPSL